MAHFVIETTIEEQNLVLEAIKQVEGETVPVSKLAKLAGLSPSRTRYVLIDLVEAGKIEKIASKAFNKHYIRYSYKLL